MRKFRDGATITVEPFRVGSFPLLKDLIVDRSALDRIVQPVDSFLSAPAPRRRRTRFRFPSTTPIWQWKRLLAFRMRAHAPRPVQMDRPCFSLLRRFASIAPAAGSSGTRERVLRMVSVMDAEGFGNCHQYVRMRSSLPSRDQRQFHCQAES